MMSNLNEATPSQLLEAFNRKMIVSTNFASIRATYDPDQLAELSLQADKAKLAILGLQNAFAPVNKLPSEVLALVFQSLVNDCNQHQSRWKRYTWLWATQVCRYWRNSALSFSVLWSTIEYSCPKLALLCLQRSKSASLDVRISLSYRCPKELPEWLPHVIPRLRSLELKCSGSHFVELLKHLAESTTPLLRDLSISFERKDLRTQIPQVDFTSVERLTFRGIVHLSLKNRFGNLVELNLVDDKYDWIRMSMPQFLDVLESNPKLMSIYIDSVSLDQKEDKKAEGRVITLRHLETLTLINGSGRCILEHMVLAPSVKMRVDTGLERGSILLAAILPHSIKNLHNLENIEEVHVTRNRDLFATASISVNARALRLDSVDPWPELFAPLSLSHIRTLCLHQVTFSDRDYHVLFLSLPALEVLALIGCCNSAAFFQGLHPPEGGALCPLLKEVRLVEICGDSQDWGDLFGLAYVRHAMGIPLRKVVIRSAQSPTVWTIASFLNRVGEVDWEAFSSRGRPLF